MNKFRFIVLYLILTVVLASSHHIKAQLPFISTWVTIQGDTEITLTIDSNLIYNYDVDWDGDGVYDSLGVNGDISHDYGVIDTFAIQIQGVYPHIVIGSSPDKDKLLSIDKWGNQPWTTMSHAFHGCSNLQIASGAGTPNLTGVTDMSYMFSYCTNLNSNMSQWDVSNADNMLALFSGCLNFSGTGIDTWDVENVVSLSQIFHICANFNGDVSNWNVSNVQNMFRAFFGCSSFDRNLGQWDISSATAMSFMLSSTSLSVENYDSTLIGWNRLDSGEIQIPTNILFDPSNLRYCFAGAERANLVNVHSWTIFDDGPGCLEDIVIDWQISFDDQDYTITIPTYPGEVYQYDVDLNNDGVFDTLGITGDFVHTYGITGVHRMRIRGTFPRMYFNDHADATKLQGIAQWGLGQWTSMANAFRGCGTIDFQDTWGTPDLSLVTDLSGAFSGCAEIMGIDWDVSNVTNFDSTFGDVRVFKADIGKWDISSAVPMNGMFAGSSMCTHLYDSLLIGWNRLDPDEVQIPSAIIFDGGPNNFCNGLGARQNLTQSLNWTISDDGHFCGTKWNPAEFVLIVDENDMSDEEIAQILSFISWTDELFWTNGLPDGERAVRIPASIPLFHPRITGEQECGGLELQDGALLEILDGGVLSVLSQD